MYSEPERLVVPAPNATQQLLAGQRRATEQFGISWDLDKRVGLLAIARLFW